MYPYGLRKTSARAGFYVGDSGEHADAAGARGTYDRLCLMTSSSSTHGPGSAARLPEASERYPGSPASSLEAEPIPGDELAAARRRLAEQNRRIEVLLQSQENERRALAHALQDQAGQSLAGIMLGLTAVERVVGDGAARDHVEALRSDVAETLRTLRELAMELRPPVLDELGLQPALRGLAGRASARHGHRIALETTGLDERLSPELETTIYRLVDELLDLLDASAEIRIALDFTADGLRIVATPADATGELILSADLLDRIRARLELNAGLLAVGSHYRHKLVAYIPLRET
jgi:histidine kinase